MISVIEDGMIFAQNKDRAFLPAKLNAIRSGELTYVYKGKGPWEEDTLTKKMILNFYLIPQTKKIALYYRNEDVATAIYGLKNRYRFFHETRSSIIDSLPSYSYVNSIAMYKTIVNADPWIEEVLSDTIGRTTLTDTTINKKLFKKITYINNYHVNDSIWQRNTVEYVIDPTDSIPVNAKYIHEDVYGIKFDQYTLTGYRFDHYDSTTFFRMIEDSLNYYQKQYTADANDPNIEQKINIVHYVDSTAPDFTAVQFKSDTVTLSESLKKNKVILLDFWYIGCMPCRYAFPTLISLYQKYNKLGLEIYGVNPKETDVKMLQRVIDQYSLPYPILIRNKSVVFSYGITGYPTIVVLDKNRKILFSEDGYSDDLEDKLTRVLDKELR